jgi:hypothetical protein
MQFKVPPGSLSWLSVLWILLGGFVAYNSFARGETTFGSIALLFVFAGTLIWLDVREVAWPLIVWFSLVIVMSIVLLLLKGVEWRRFSSMILAAYTIYDLYHWRRSEE